MNPRTKLAFFGDDDDDLNLQPKPIDDQKAKTYTQGNLRKSKREKEKEAEDAKRAEEEIEAAKAYADFIDAFDAPDRPASSKMKSMGFVKASSGSGPAQEYDPLAKKRDSLPTGPRARQRSPPPPLPPGSASAPKAKGKRAMDAFLEELKRDQADREARFQKHTQGSGSSITALAAFEGQHGSRDRGDPLTTNIFVTNLPMGITEQSLGMFFAKHGPVGSVKIMWPRGDAIGGPGGDITARRGKAAGMSGFVSYMNRKSAEECVREMDGFNWGGCALRVGWSKAVPIAARPAYVPDEDQPRRHSRSPSSRSRSRSGDKDRRPVKRARYSPSSPSRDRGRRDSRSRSRSPSRSRSRSRPRSGERFSRRRLSRTISRSQPRSRSRARSGGDRRYKDSRKDSRSPSVSGRSRSRSEERRRRDHSRPRSPSRSRSRSRSRDERRWSRSPLRRHKRSYDKKESRSRSPSRSYSRRRKSRSRSPAQRRWPSMDDETRSFVTTVANRVKEHGAKFEQVLKHRERNNPKFSFLYDNRLPTYHLFLSIARPGYKCPYADIPFLDDGENSIYSTDSEEESERERARKGALGRLAERRFQSMLRALTGRRGEMAKCMAFSLEHADAVSEVVDVIISSLLVPSTAVPRKIARLHLVCDILHNSAAAIPNAWKFRQEFQSRLPAVFDHMSDIRKSFPGRITAETFKKQVLGVVEVWEDWIVFPPDFTSELRERLDGQWGKADEGGRSAEGGAEGGADVSARRSIGGAELVLMNSKFKSSSFKPAIDSAVPAKTSAGGNMEDDVDGMEVDGDDLEGEAMPMEFDPKNGANGRD
ncbi:hypothetical protein FRB94_008917 [Tulasnella sp. JGI-2019a]|nr:hypothetical protein FRB94_008917 [Tulasnella sp. JGI-2019a]